MQIQPFNLHCDDCALLRMVGSNHIVAHTLTGSAAMKDPRCVQVAPALWSVPILLLILTTACASRSSQAPTVATPPLDYAWDDPQLTEKVFKEYLKTLDFEKGKKNEKDRKCKTTGSECLNEATDRIRMEIRPEAGARELDPNALDPRGHVIALLIHKGKATEATYDLPADQKEVYWLISPGAARFVWFDKNGVKQSRGPFKYTVCGDGVEHPNNGLEADFSDCKNTVMTQTTERGDEPAWISCLAGCCIAEIMNR